VKLLLHIGKSTGLQGALKVRALIANYLERPPAEVNLCLGCKVRKKDCNVRGTDGLPLRENCPQFKADLEALTSVVERDIERSCYITWWEEHLPATH